MTALITPPLNTVTSLESQVIHNVSALAYGYDGVTAVEGDSGAMRIATITYFPVYYKGTVRVVARFSAEVKKESLYNGRPIWQNVIPPDGQPPNSIPSFFCA